MVAPIVVALLPALLLNLRRQRYAVSFPLALSVTIGTTLLLTTFITGALVQDVEDPGLAIAILLVVAPIIAVPVATSLAIALVRSRGYGIATMLMAAGGWTIGLFVFAFVSIFLPIASLRATVPEPGLYAALAIFYAIPASYAATAAVYAGALGKRRI